MSTVEQRLARLEAAVFPSREALGAAILEAIRAFGAMTSEADSGLPPSSETAIATSVAPAGRATGHPHVTPRAAQCPIEVVFGPDDFIRCGRARGHDGEHDFTRRNP